MSQAKVRPVPEGHHTVTPHLVIRGAAAAIDFYKKAFGATEIARMPMNNKIGHAELKIGNSFLFLADEFPEMGACAPAPNGSSPVTIHLYMDDCDKTFNQAVAAGAKAKMPPVNMFWGDRYAKIQDPFGHEWSIATHIEDVAPADMMKRMEAAMSEKHC